MVKATAKTDLIHAVNSPASAFVEDEITFFSTQATEKHVIKILGQGEPLSSLAIRREIIADLARVVELSEPSIPTKNFLQTAGNQLLAELPPYGDYFYHPLYGKLPVVKKLDMNQTPEKIGIALKQNGYPIPSYDRVENILTAFIDRVVRFRVVALKRSKRVWYLSGIFAENYSNRRNELRVANDSNAATPGEWFYYGLFETYLKLKKKTKEAV